MNNKKQGSSALTLVLVIITLVSLGTAGWFWYGAETKNSNNPNVSESISSFDDCVAAGFPVAESFPRQCFVPNGAGFTEEIKQTETEAAEYVEYTSQKGEIVKIKTPRSGYVIGSPLIIEGQVKGSWSFEASFPLELLDANKKLIVEDHATLQGDWMSEEYVSFKATLNFKNPAGLTNGFLVLRKDNPSGLAENEDFLEIPVGF